MTKRKKRSRQRQSETRSLHDARAMEDGVVHLNVGGVVFPARRSTLVASNSFFAGAMRAHPECCELFVDRDPTYFRHVLNWLRGVRYLPDDDATLRELQWEADYFCLDDMCEAIRCVQRRFSIPHTLEGIHNELRHRNNAA